MDGPDEKKNSRKHGKSMIYETASEKEIKRAENKQVTHTRYSWQKSREMT